jgi:mannitol 2-dehydrogenase
MVKLNSSTLDELRQSQPEVTLPSYDLHALTPGIVHIGVGAFHRSHQAMYLDRLLNAGGHTDWAICGVGLVSFDERMRDVMAEQDHLYTLATWHPDGQAEARVIGAISEYLYAPDDMQAVLEKLADPAVKIVSLTVTEGGYNVNDATGEFDGSNPEVLKDLAPGAVPRTVFGVLTESLRLRRERGAGAFTVMSCDNIQGNGHVAHKALTSFARLKDPELSDWIAEQVAFPNSMVDRITPATTDAMRQQVAALYGIDDAWPVIAEDFTQWVLEDHFSLGRPPLEEVGVQIVHDVEPYELMKLRLLNASHQAMSYLGLLAGYTYAHEVCQDGLFRRFLLGYMAREAAPTLRPVPGIDLAAYQQQLIDRFASTAIQDTLARLVFDASERIPKFLLPVLREQLASGGEIAHCALVVASWARFLEGHDEAGRPMPIQDRRAEQLQAAARQEQEQPGAFLEQRDVFGDLGSNPRFVSAYLAARESLKTRGALGTLRALLEQPEVSGAGPVTK